MGTWGRQRVLKKDLRDPWDTWRSYWFRQWDQRYWTRAGLPGLHHWIRSFLFHGTLLRKYMEIATVAAFPALFHLILPTPWHGYYFIPILQTRKVKPRMVNILLKVTEPGRVQPRKCDSKSHALCHHKLYSMLLLATCRCWAGSLPSNHGRSQMELCLRFFYKLIWPHYPITKEVCTSLIKAGPR